MKLQKKISLYFLGFSLLIFLLSILVTFLVIRDLVQEEVNETLEAEKNNLLVEFGRLSDKGAQLETHSYRLEIYPIPKNIQYKESLKDTLIFVGEEGEGVPFRQIKSSQIINGKNYLIILRRSLIEREDLITGITILLGTVFFLVFLALNIINYFGEKKWWKPFYETLDKLSNFRLSQKEDNSFGRSDIDEFNKLNESLEELTTKMKADYKNLKEFSENASHEMQTPLAIMRSKLDVMIQGENLSEEQFNSIRSLYDAVNRLSKLNRSLNLLTKIENREFSAKSDIVLSELINNSLKSLEELIVSKSLKVTAELNSNIVLHINTLMGETLISNLLMNAIKHNFENGKIIIELTDEYLEIKNTGKPPQVEPDKLFERFKKDNQTSDSPGLGLSIVKEICELNKYNVEYNFIKGLHIIKLEF